MSSIVKLHIYDLSKGMAKALSPMFLGFPIDGVWHSGVVVHGREIYFGAGIRIDKPGQTHLGPPDKVVELGETEVPWDMVETYLEELAPQWKAEHYHLLDHNCNDFSSEVSQFLTGNDIPSDVRDVAKKVAGTPLGQMLAEDLRQGNGQRVYGLE